MTTEISSVYLVEGVISKIVVQSIGSDFYAQKSINVLHFLFFSLQHRKFKHHSIYRVKTSFNIDRKYKYYSV